MLLVALTAQEVLDRVEANFKEPASMVSVSTMILQDFDGTGREVRTSKTWVLKDFARMTKFLSPPGQRGVGVLIKYPGTSKETIYLYLPAFRRIRRIASSSMKSSSFQGTDFSYSDLSSGFSYKGDYRAVSVKQAKVDGADGYILTLSRKPGSDRPYTKVVLYVDSRFFIRKAELHDSKGLWKVLEIREIKNFSGYNIPTNVVMRDIRRKHSTTIKTTSVKVNASLSRAFFSLANLRRPPRGK